MDKRIALDHPNTNLKGLFEQFVMEKEGPLRLNYQGPSFDFLDGGAFSIDSLRSRRLWEQKGKIWAKKTTEDVRKFINTWRVESESLI